MALWEADSRHARELSVFCFAKKPIHHLQLVDKKIKKPSKTLTYSCSLKSVFAPGFLVLVTPETLSVKLWGGSGGDSGGAFGEALRRLGEAWEALGASKLILGPPLGGFGRLWETLGEPLGRLWEALGSFGRRWGSLWGVFGRLWGSFGSLSEPFFSSRLLFLPHI